MSLPCLVGYRRGVLKVCKIASYYHLFLDLKGSRVSSWIRTHLLALKSSQTQITAWHFGEGEDTEKFSETRTKNSFYKPRQQ